MKHLAHLQEHKAEKEDLEKLSKDIYAKLEQLFKQIQQMNETLKEHASKLQYLAGNMGSGSGGISEEIFQKLVVRVDKLEALVKTLQSQLVELISKMTGQPAKTIEMPTSDDSSLKELIQRMNEMQKDIDYLKNEFAKWIKEMQDGLNKKADIESLNNLEKMIMEKLTELIKAFGKQFADKNDTKKAIKLIERQLKNLYDIVMSRNGEMSGNPNEDDAMFTKKPLGGMSCASCEKDIINLQGRKVNFHPWGKFPLRDPSERIARVGQGFSKMLSLINPETLSKIDTAASQARYSSINGPRGSYGQNTLYSSQGMRGIKHHLLQGSQENLYSEEGHDTMPEMGSTMKPPGTAFQGSSGPKTMTNFYSAKQKQNEEPSNRPGSGGQVLPKPRIINKFAKTNIKKQ